MIHIHIQNDHKVVFREDSKQTHGPFVIRLTRPWLDLKNKFQLLRVLLQEFLRSYARLRNMFKIQHQRPRLRRFSQTFVIFMWVLFSSFLLKICILEPRLGGDFS